MDRRGSCGPPEALAPGRSSDDEDDVHRGSCARFATARVCMCAPQEATRARHAVAPGPALLALLCSRSSGQRIAASAATWICFAQCASSTLRNASRRRRLQRSTASSHPSRRRWRHSRGPDLRRHWRIHAHRGRASHCVGGTFATSAAKRATGRETGSNGARRQHPPRQRKHSRRSARSRRMALRGGQSIPAGLRDGAAPRGLPHRRRTTRRESGRGAGRDERGGTGGDGAGAAHPHPAAPAA